MGSGGWAKHTYVVFGGRGGGCLVVPPRGFGLGGSREASSSSSNLGGSGGGVGSCITEISTLSLTNMGSSPTRAEIIMLMDVETLYHQQ